MVQCPTIARRPIAACAAQRARAERCVACQLPRDNQRSGARVSVTRKPAARWRSQLARQTTVLRRKRKACRRCSVLL